MLLIYSENSIEEMILKPDILKTHGFKDSPKYWFSYIRMFLFKHAKHLMDSANYYHFKLTKYLIQRTEYFFSNHSCISLIHFRKKGENETSLHVQLMLGTL